jgi:elongation factor Ts
VSIDVQAVKALRDSTGAGMMDAKVALEEAKGDAEKAVEILRKKGIAKAGKKADRETTAGLVESYNHMGRVGSMVELACETDFVARTDDYKTLAHDLAMQVAASNPLYTNPEDVPKDVLAKEREIFMAEAKEQGKPEAVLEKIAAGKLEKYYQEVCLIKQPFIKDPDRSVEDILTEAIAKLGENIVIRRFARFELGV